MARVWSVLDFHVPFNILDHVIICNLLTPKMYNEELLLTNIFIVIYELNIHHTETMKMKKNTYIIQTFTELIFPKLVLVI